MIILAVDPGQHCGLAARLSDGSLTHTMIHNDLPATWDYIQRLQPNVIVVERFVTAGRIGRDGLDAVELQGSVFGIGWTMGSLVYVQTPIDRMPFLEEARTLIGANRTKIQSHAVDAVAHLLRWEFMTEHNRQRKPIVGGARAT